MTDARDRDADRSRWLERFGWDISDALTGALDALDAAERRVEERDAVLASCVEALERAAKTLQDRSPEEGGNSLTPTEAAHRRTLRTLRKSIRAALVAARGVTEKGGE